MDIFNQFLEALNDSSTSKSITKKTALKFFLGKNLAYGYEEDQYYRFSKNISIYSVHAQLLLLNDNWEKQYFEQIFDSTVDLSSFMEKLHLISRENNIPTQADDSLSQLMERLVLKHFKIDESSKTLFPQYKSRHCINYVPWNDMEKNILELIQKNNIVFVTGNPGSGKKELISAVLEQYPSPTRDFYISLSTSSKPLHVEQHIHELTFLYDASAHWDANRKIRHLNDKPASSVLVLDCPIIEEKDFVFIKEHFSNSNMRLVILTYRQNIPEEFISKSINMRGSNNLKQIFTASNHTVTYTDDEFEHLCSIISNNPLAMTLVSKTLSVKPSLRNAFLDKTKWLWKEKSMPTIHTNYKSFGKKSAFKFTSLLSNLLLYYPDDLLKNTLSEMSIWTKHPLDRLILEKKFKKEDIELALQYGILQALDNNSNLLYMPALLADTIWYEYPIEYEQYRNQIDSFLQLLKIGNPLPLPFTDLYPVIFNMIHRFHFQITYLPTRINEQQKVLFEDWNHILMELILNLMKWGNHKEVERLIPELFLINQKKEIQDLASTEENLIRQVFYSQLKFRQTLDIPLYMTELQDLLNQMAIETNYSSKTLTFVNYLFPFFQDCLDYILRIKRTYDTFNTVDQHDLVNIDYNRMKKLYSVALPFFYTIRPDLYYYYTITCLLMDASASSTFQQYGQLISMAKKYVQVLNSTNNTELSIKADCLILYHNLVHYQKNRFLFETELASALLSDLATEYNRLSQAILNNLLPWETTELFHLCTILLTELPIDSLTLNNVRIGLKSYYQYITEQICLSEKEKKEALSFIEKIPLFEHPEKPVS